jgi:hypothetical protein
MCRVRYVMNRGSAWLQLVTSLPTENATERMRVWRALKASGAGVLRDGVYVLPERPDLQELFAGLAAEITEAGGSAHVLRVEPRDEAQAEALRALVDRTKDYAALVDEIGRARKRFTRRDPAAVRRQSRTLRRQFEAIVATDFFPGATKVQAEAALLEMEAAATEILSPGEPYGQRGPIRRLDRSLYRRRVWATRQAPWVDRLACAWLIKRHIDPAASFVWLETPADLPTQAVGFDFDGAPFTHVESRVTFEVLLKSFDLEGDGALRRLGDLVHYLDVGGIPVPDAAGVGTMLTGAKQSSRDDDQLLKHALALFDWLYTAYTDAESDTERGSD